MGPDRRGSENDPVEGGAKILRSSLKVLHHPNISTHPIPHDRQMPAIGSGKGNDRVQATAVEQRLNLVFQTDAQESRSTC